MDLKKPVVAGLAALSLSGSGCATMSDEERQEWRDWANVTGSILSVSGMLSGDFKEAGAGDALVRAAEADAMSEIARRGGTQVHVYPERERSRVYRGCEEFSGYRGIENWVVDRYGDCVPVRENNPTFDNGSPRLSPEGQRNKDRVAREMAMERSNLDLVYVEGEGTISFPKGYGFGSIDNRVIRDGVFAFGANYYRDFNENGTKEPVEFGGRGKDVFAEDEVLMLVLYDIRSIPGQRSLEVFSPSGRKIHESTSLIPGCMLDPSMGLLGRNVYLENHVHKDQEGNYISPHLCEQTDTGYPLSKMFVEEGGYGNFRAVWKNNGDYIGSYEFEIVPSTENQNE